METNNIITISVIGLYTLVYVVVFFIQKSSIEKMKAVTASMESYMMIFDIDKIKSFVALKEEESTMKSVKFITDNVKMDKVAEKAMEIAKNTGIIKEVYTKQVKEDLEELIQFIVTVLVNQKKEDRDELIKKQLPITKRYISGIVDDELKKNA